MHKEYDPGREKEAFHQYFGLDAMKKYCTDYPALTRKEIFNTVRGYFTGFFPHLREDDYDTLRILIPGNLKVKNDLKKHYPPHPTSSGSSR